MTYPEQVKSFLWSDIHKMSECPGRFAKNPDADFSRKRKLDFENLMRFLISMESGTTGHELLNYSGYSLSVPSNAAFYQQRKKLLPDAFQHLLFQFNLHFSFDKYKGKYQLIACDGSEFNIARDPDDPNTFHPPSGKSTKGFNMLHTISLYDILNKRYLDCVVQPGRKKTNSELSASLLTGIRTGAALSSLPTEDFLPTTSSPIQWKRAYSFLSGRRTST